jgi:hypothetical protein
MAVLPLPRSPTGVDVGDGVIVDVGVGDGVIVEVGVGVGVGERCWLSACATIGKSTKDDVKSKAIATLPRFCFIRIGDASGSICFIGVFIVLFPFRVVFVIRHLFPEIRDEVPENVSKRLKFFIRPRHEASAFAQDSD